MVEMFMMNFYFSFFPEWSTILTNIRKKPSWYINCYAYGKQMKLPFSCMKCLIDNGRPSDVIAYLELRDDGRYVLFCENGHQTTTILQQERFEILFDIGSCGISDGYYREAVSSFTSSLEQFYEYFVKVVLLNRKTDIGSLESTWKQIAKQSERQMGAFVITYLSEFGNPPAILSNKNVQFRNDVIHRGKIPSRQEALQYGQAVLDLIRPQLIQLRDKCPEGIQAAVFQHMKSCRTQEDQGKQVATMSVATILSWSMGEGRDEPLLDKALTVMKTWRRFNA
jgi:hypothetical protein